MSCNLELPLPTEIKITCFPAEICDTDGDTCVKVEENPDDDTVRLIANSNEIMTATEDEVTIKGGIIEKVDTIMMTTTLLPNQKVIKIDATGGNIIVTLPPCASNEGRKYSIARIDASGNSVIIKPTLGDKLLNVVDQVFNLNPGGHNNFQCLGSPCGWFWL